MLFLLSPAKSLDYVTQLSPCEHSLPLFAPQSAELIELLRPLSVPEVAQLMDLSEALAALNVQRYQDWSPKFTAKNSRQALLAFNGDVYGGLDAKSLNPEDLQWAQQHLCILSGLYGVLRPLDRMQPYRLEMGTALANTRGANLYRFWAGHIAPYLNQRLARDESPVIVNLASQEYFKAVDLKALKGRVLECVFEEYKDGKYKLISFFAKRARGLMARYALKHRLTLPQQLQAFDLEGYAYAPASSTPDRLVFRRKAGSPS
jgi:cytoplasmic iron level regulating protein YaaA (DUF328/UPF0246 family)